MATSSRLPLLPALDRFATFGEPDARAMQTMLSGSVADWTFGRRPNGDYHPPVESGTVMMEAPAASVSIACTLNRGPGHPTTLETLFPIVANPTSLVLDIDDVSYFPPEVRPAIAGDIVIAENRSLPIRFLDTHRVTTSPSVLPGDRWKVAVAAIALRFRRFEPVPMEVSADTAQLIGIDPTTKLATNAMTAWLPSARFGDVVQFVGFVASVDDLGPTIAGMPAYRYSIVMARDDGELRVPVIVTRHVLGNNSAPRLGEQVEGLAWLQGRALAQLGRTPPIALQNKGSISNQE